MMHALAQCECRGWNLTGAVRFALAGVLTLAVGVTAALGQAVEEHDSEVISSGSPRTALPPKVPDLREAARLVFKRTNQFRAEHDLPNLAHNDALEHAADYFARYMARTGRYGHTADGQRPMQRVEEHGYEPCIVAENIAWELNTRQQTAESLAEAFMTGWIQSPEHRRNLLDPDVKELGVSLAHSLDTDQFYAVQDFGRPKSLAIHVRVSNPTTATISYKLGDHEFSLPPGFIRTHEICRPGKIAFQLPKREAGSSGESFPIDGDAQFQVTRGSSGNVEVEPSPGAPGAR
jgi:uncharacterized protein YkwD